MRFSALLGVLVSLTGCKDNVASTVKEDPLGQNAAPANGDLVMCTEQRAPGDQRPAGAAVARAGDTERQLAPSYLENMVQCGEKMPDVSAVPDGTINADGDCEYQGVGGLAFTSCHYHLGIEFVSAKLTRRPGFGEIHCIFPTAKGPVVFGGHFQCSNQGKRRAEISHDKFPGAVCSAGLLRELKAQHDRCSAEYCCDDGTLTGNLTGRSDKNALVATVNRTLNMNLQNGLGIRPDFRLCAEPMPLECDELALWTGHTANSPALGLTAREFAPTFGPAGEKAIAAARAALGTPAGEHHGTELHPAAEGHPAAGGPIHQ